MVASALEEVVDKVIVGADRILRTGHVFNKVGTLNMAIAAKHFGVPFYVAAPLSTFDMETPHGEVKIEERDAREVTEIAGCSIAPRGVDVWNPAFDKTPPELVDSIITEKGLVRPTEIAEIVPKWLSGA